ncbi:TRAP transporter large permease subunit [Enterococcus sp. AZ109]|uniref:TRAP transporter large permease subunit n=1 Tax=Enterococcus sp. AZ109 TaxID=2774634 RepID=UPI003F296CEC
MGTAIIALIVYIAVIIIWATIIKRNMAEGMIVGFLCLSVFGGTKAPTYLFNGFVSALSNEVLFASLAFILMSYLIKESQILNGILAIFNSLLGRFRGGPAFVNIGLSAILGMLSGSNSANSATSGSFTAQWMIETGWKKETTATLIAGNGGLGAGFPPSASMFIMLGFAPIAAAVTEGNLYIALFVSGLYQVIYRIILVMLLMKKEGIQKIDSYEIAPLGTSFKANWQCLLVFLGAIIPVLVTVGPIGSFLRANGMGDGVSEISLLVWIPISMITIILVMGRKILVEKVFHKEKIIQTLFPQYKNIGGILLFAFAASEIFSEMGLGDELIVLFNNLNLPKPILILMIGAMVVLVAGPLSSTATLTSVGLISYMALVSVGVTPIAAVVAILVFASTEGASPPASGSIFIAAGLTGSEPEKTFFPLIKYFVLPILLLGWMIAMGLLPLFV